MVTKKTTPIWVPVAMSFSAAAIGVPPMLGRTIPYMGAVIVVALGVVGLTNTLFYLHKRITDLER